MKFQDVWTVVRDITSFVVGVAGVIHQEFMAPTVKPELLILYGTLIAVPGAAGLLQLRQQGGTSTTGQSSSPSPSPSPAPSSSSPSSST